jgi:tetratricopeptide (TPR) repeat protein
MRRLAVLGCLLLGACAHVLHPERQEWFELRSTHFLVRSDLPKEEAARAVIELEEVRETFARFISSSAPQPAGRMQVVQLADTDELEEFVGRGIGGFATADAFGRPITVMGVWRSSRPLPILQHELAHLVSFSVLPRQPAWFAEGLATYFETVRRDATKAVMVVGEPQAERVWFLDHRFPGGWRKMVDDKSVAVTYGFETAAWLLVHYLVDRRPKQFDAFMDLLATGKDPSAAFSTAFGEVTEGRLDKELHAYFRSGAIGTLSVQIPAWSGEIAVRRLAPAEIRALRGQVHALVGNFQAAKREISQALSFDPGQPEAIATRAKLPGIERSEQLELARKASKLHPDDARAWIALVDALPKTPGPERHEAAQAALRAGPDEPAALVAGAWDAIDAGEARQGAGYARGALSIAPWSIDAMEALAAATAGEGECERAAELLERAVGMLGSHRSSTDKADRLRARRASFAAGAEACQGAVRQAAVADAEK